MPTELSRVDVMSFFPPGWKPREEQRDAILKIQRQFESGKRIVAFQGPTGMGKTLIAQTFALMTKAMGGRTHYLTIQKALQDQLVKQFPEIVALKGRANYECTHEDSLGENADKGVCRVKGKGILAECVELENRPETLADAVNLLLPAHCHKCPYWKQAQIASEAVIAAFTFSSFLFQQRLGRFGAREFMVVDECHNIENELMRFVTIELTEKALEPLRLTIDRDINTQEELLRWIQETDIHDKLLRLLGAAAYRTDDIAEGLTLEQTDTLRSLRTRIEYFRSLLEKTDWVVETQMEPDKRGRRRRKVVGRPLFVRDFAKELLFSNGRQVLCMSATILDFPIWAGNLGLDTQDVGYVEGPCTFPAKNRPIHLAYAGAMGLRHFEAGDNPTRPKLMAKIREILRIHRGQRGIIHCHSNTMAKAIIQDIDSPRFLHQANFENENKTLLLAEHAAGTDSVIVAPGMHEGIDLHDDLARFSIIAKIPWPGMGDKLIAERKLRDERFYSWLCALKLVQSYGRSVRCFDLQTEILTTSGWKNVDTLRVGAIAYGVDPKAFEGTSRRPMRWGRLAVLPNPVTAINRTERPEKTIHIKTNAVDAVITPDHTMIVQTRKISSYRSITRRQDKTYEYAQNHACTTQGLKKVAAADLQERFKIPCAGWAVGRKRTKHSPDWFWLMGFIIGDGHINRSRNIVQLFQSTAPSQKQHVAKLTMVLENLGLTYRYDEDKATGTCFGYERNGKRGIWTITGYNSARIRDMFDRGMIRRYSQHFSYRARSHRGVDGWKTPDKRIPRWILKRAAPVEMLALLEGMMAADGTVRNLSRRSHMHVNGQYWTSDRILADQLQELLSLCGFRSRLSVTKERTDRRKEQLCVSFVNPATSDVVRSTSVRPGPTTPVWCPSTELGSVIARRNGKVFIAGNSKEDWAYAYIVDSNFEMFLNKNRAMLPGWLIEALRRGMPTAAPGRP